MTLIISTICPDGFVLTSDGRAVDVRTNEVLTNAAKKTFYLGNGIHGAFSGQGIPKNMHEILIDAASENLNFNVAYSMEDVCSFIREVFLLALVEIVDDTRFRLECIVAGHDRSLGNRKLRARHFILSSKNDYQIDEGYGILTAGAEISEEEMDALQEASEKSVKASNRANKKLIQLISKTNIQVGGKITSVTVRNDG